MEEPSSIQPVSSTLGVHKSTDDDALAEGEAISAPRLDGVEWSSGFCHTWIHRSLAKSLSDFSGDDDVRDGSRPVASVKAVFYLTFLESIFNAHKHIESRIQRDVLSSQLILHGRRISRVDNALYGYLRDGFSSTIPGMSFSRAWQTYIESAAPSNDADGMVLVTEKWCDDEFGARHTFKIESAVFPQSQNVLYFSADHWRSIELIHDTSYDYFLACNETEYTTLLDFLARLHLITSRKEMAVAPDGRLFLADALETIYSPMDATIDLSARSRFIEILRFLLEHLELTAEMQSVLIDGPQGIKDGTWLATLPQLRKCLIRLAQSCNDWDSPILNLDWATRIRSFLRSRLPAVSKAGIDLAIKACGERKQSAQVVNNVNDDKETFTIRYSGHLLSSPKHVIYKSRGLPEPEPVCDPREYMICSVRARIDSDYCGCGTWQRLGDGSHVIGFDCTIRAKELGHAKRLCSEVDRLFNSDLIMNEGGRQSSAPSFRTASSILLSLRELNLIQDDNFDQETLSIVNLELGPRKVWPLLAMVWKGSPLRELHNYLMKPPGEWHSYDQETEITISKLATVCITCCVTSVLHELHFWKGRKGSILSNFDFFKDTTIDIPEGSMIVNLVLKALNTADAPLLQAALGTVYETHDNSFYARAFRAVIDRHPQVLSCNATAIKARTDMPCSCVVCTAVVTTRLNGTWRTDLLREYYLVSGASLALIKEPKAGAADLLSAMTLSRRLFLGQCGYNYVMHNAPAPHESEKRYNITIQGSLVASRPIQDEEDRRIMTYYEQFDIDNRSTRRTPGEMITAYWKNDDQVAVDRVRSAIIIGRQSTDIDMSACDVFEPAAGFENDAFLQTKFEWPAWLCEMIVREAHEHVPAGSSHWAAASAIDLARSKATSDKTSPLKDGLIPSKHSIIQPHPAYDWPLERTPESQEIVLVDILEKKRICCTLDEIAELEPKPVFASHVWETKYHPDPTGRQISQILLRWEGVRYIWLDYMCLPQGARDESEEQRFSRTLRQLSTIQTLMTTRTIQDEYDKREWERRGWTVVESLIGNVSSPFSQAVFRHFQEHGSLGDVFNRLRIRVTNQSDVAVLELVLKDWISIQRAGETEAGIKLQSMLPSKAFPLIRNSQLIDGSLN